MVSTFSKKTSVVHGQDLLQLLLDTWQLIPLPTLHCQVLAFLSSWELNAFSIKLCSIVIPSFEQKRSYSRDVLLCPLETLLFSSEQESLDPLIALKTYALRDFWKRSNEFAKGGKALATLIYLNLSSLNEMSSFPKLFHLTESSRLLQKAVHGRS